MGVRGFFDRIDWIWADAAACVVVGESKTLALVVALTIAKSSEAIRQLPSTSVLDAPRLFRAAAFLPQEEPINWGVSLLVLHLTGVQVF